MKFFHRQLCNATLVSLCLAVANGAYAQVSSINSVIINPRVWNDVPGATLSTVSLYPAVIAFGEANVSAPTGYANRDTWQFSNNGGTNVYQFQNNDYFSASMTLQLSGGTGTYYPEAGFLFSTANVGDIQSILKTDGEVVQFGGISFFSFNPPLVDTSGATFNMGLNYFLDTTTGDNALQFFVNGNASPVFDFAPGAGIGDGSTLGGYFQIPQDSANPANSGSAVFQNISIQPSAVPEPSTWVLLSAGILPLLLRRRRF
jgi:hypothetical protein